MTGYAGVAMLFSGRGVALANPAAPGWAGSRGKVSLYVAALYVTCSVSEQARA